MLAPYLDEIELLLFESTPGSLPSIHEVKQLLSLANEFDLTYNIHLPLDIYLGAPERSIRRFALDTIKQIVDLTASLSPSTYTLHLPSNGGRIVLTRALKNWFQAESMEK
ncbi:MAG: hypothetical protein JRF45_11650 [Deltaproteobacteria bacterium]|nr:hypothetical protein [Deltaproteobacteria bacterium]